MLAGFIAGCYRLQCPPLPEYDGGTYRNIDFQRIEDGVLVANDDGVTLSFTSEDGSEWLVEWAVTSTY